MALDSPFPDRGKSPEAPAGGFGDKTGTHREGTENYELGMEMSSAEVQHQARMLEEFQRTAELERKRKRTIEESDSHEGSSSKDHGPAPTAGQRGKAPSASALRHAAVMLALQDAETCIISADTSIAPALDPFDELYRTHKDLYDKTRALTQTVLTRDLKSGKV